MASETPGSPPNDPDSVPEWLKAEGEACDVVLSTRVRLARNLRDVPFAAKANKAQRRSTARG